MAGGIELSSLYLGRLSSPPSILTIPAIIAATSYLVGMNWSDGRISYINKAGREMLGIGLDEDVTSIELDDIYTDWAADLLTGNAVTTSLDQGVWMGESALQPRIGDPIPVSQIVLAYRRPVGEVEFMSPLPKTSP